MHIVAVGIYFWLLPVYNLWEPPNGAHIFTSSHLHILTGGSECSITLNKMYGPLLGTVDYMQFMNYSPRRRWLQVLVGEALGARPWGRDFQCWGRSFVRKSCSFGSEVSGAKSRGQVIPLFGERMSHSGARVALLGARLVLFGAKSRGRNVPSMPP